jgi:hypothetical protein
MRVVPEARVAGFEPTLAKAAIAEAPGCGRASVYKQNMRAPTENETWVIETGNDAQAQRHTRQEAASATGQP